MTTARTEALKGATIPGMVLPALARWAVTDSAILTADESPFRGTLVTGDERVLVVTGENASGKSLAFRLIMQLANSGGVEPIPISIRERTASGTDEMARMKRAFAYGDEETSSTGSVSARVVQSGFDALDTRAVPAILALDEPEIGLSDGYARALGEYIGARAQGMAGNACGVMVVTHSRALARGLLAGLEAEPTLVAMLGREDEPVASLAQWIETTPERTIDDLLGLREVAHERFRAVSGILRSGR
jgi:hypothetical protein